MLIVTNFVNCGHITFFTMDISLFSRTIKELILENDRVGVPRVGHFLAELMPATFSACRTMINPPYRRMSFSKDGVTVAERDIFLHKMEEISGLPPAQVAEEYDMFIRGFISDLESEKSVDLPSLGRMYATSCNEYFFVADEDLDIYPDGIGLKPVSVKAPDPDFVPVAPPEPEPESTTEYESDPVEVAVIDPETIEDNEFIEELEEEKESEPETEPVPEPDAEPASEPLSDPKPWNEQDSDLVIETSKKRVGLWVIVTIIALVIVVALLLYYFRDSQWLSPILDKLLYTKEELRILGR